MKVVDFEKLDLSMPEYDFSTLSPPDFELLSRDLLQKALKVDLESFKTGRDKGIDLRYSKPNKGDLWIVQAKHYLRSGYDQLKYSLKTIEKKKLAKLNPTRYIVTTSVSFSPQMKDELYRLLQPYCISPSDIFGQEDLNNLLGKFPQIEKAHFKLWLPSTSVLERLLNNGVFTQSALEEDEIKRQLSLFVPTAAVDRSLDLLNKHGFCMLTGIPGIGKTTTARLIVARHIHDNWQGIYLSGHVRDAFSLYKPKERQIFFYDDFLGLTSLQERLAKNEDKDLVQLIKACKRSPATKRLVLTTRGYLYEQACKQHESLSNRAGLETSQSIVELSDYTNRIRAQILVNHLYFYGIAPEVCSEFVSSGVARKTLDHANYNPRIVESMCELKRANGLSGKQFGQEFLRMLEHPGEIWEHAFRNQLTQGARELLLVFAVHGSSVELQGLKHSFMRYVEATGNSGVGFEAAFESYLKELDGSFLRVSRGANCTYLAYHNPAIKDFTDAELNRDFRLLEIAFKELSYEGVLLFTAKKLMEDHSERINASELLEAINRADRDTQYVVSERGQRRTLMHNLSRVRALRVWLELILKKGDRSVTEAFFKILEEFFDGDDCKKSVNEFVVDLYFAYVEAVAKVQRKKVFSSDRLREILLPGCVSPDCFVAVAKLLPKDSRSSVALERMQQAFEEKYWTWLQEEVSDGDSSGQIREAIDSVLAAAEILKVNEQELDLSEAEYVYEKILETEDAKADIQMEEMYFEREAEHEESREVNDILDSLRE